MTRTDCAELRVRVGGKRDAHGAFESRRICADARCSERFSPSDDTKECVESSRWAVFQFARRARGSERASALLDVGKSGASE